MRMALYEPGYGYYISGLPKMGWEGDYYTSTDISGAPGIFANCMGRQLLQMWEKLGRPAKFIVLEQGAGRGDLAQAIRTWAQLQTPEFNAALDYRTEDISAGQDVIAVSSEEKGGWAGRGHETGRGQATATGRPQGSPLQYTQQTHQSEYSR